MILPPQRKEMKMNEEEFELDASDYGDVQEGEMYAEFVMSWVNGGGSYRDANIAWNQGIAHRAGYRAAPEGAKDPNFNPPYYMGLTPEKREADSLESD